MELDEIGRLLLSRQGLRAVRRIGRHYHVAERVKDELVRRAHGVVDRVVGELPKDPIRDGELRGRPFPRPQVARSPDSPYEPHGDRPAWGRDEVAKGWPIVLAMESALDAFGAVRAAAAAAHAHVEPIVGQHRAGFQGSVVRVVDARRAFSARNVVVVEPIVGELPPSCSPGGVGGHSYTAKEAARNWPIVLAGPVAAGRMDPAAPRAVGCGPASEAGA